jgi:uncharacterized RDD family membrane protein YckC
MKYKERKLFQNEGLILATIPHRFFAWVIDWIIIWLLIITVLLLFSWIGPDLEVMNIENLLQIKFHVELESKSLSEITGSILKIVIAFLPVVYFAIITYFTNGLTIGKKILGIRVLSLYHSRLNFWHCTERSLGYIASSLELGLGFFQALWNPNRMALHDKIGETIVVKKQ